AGLTVGRTTQPSKLTKAASAAKTHSAGRYFIGDTRRIDRRSFVMHHQLREADHTYNPQDLDTSEGHGAPIDLAGLDRCNRPPGDPVNIGFPRRNRTQVEKCKPERRMHETGLHIHTQYHPEPDQIDAKTFRRRRKQWHDDESQFEEIKEECK